MSFRSSSGRAREQSASLWCVALVWSRVQNIWRLSRTSCPVEASVLETFAASLFTGIESISIEILVHEYMTQLY